MDNIHSAMEVMWENKIRLYYVCLLLSLLNIMYTLAVKIHKYKKIKAEVLNLLRPITDVKSWTTTMQRKEARETTVESEEIDLSY